MNFDELILNYCAITNTNRIKTVNMHLCGNSPIEVSRKFLVWFSIFSIIADINVFGIVRDLFILS